MWRRANATAAVATIISGFVFLLLLEKGIGFRLPNGPEVRLMPPLWDAIAWITPYRRAYQHSALLTWIFSMIVMVVVSLATPRKATAESESILWNRSYLSLPADLKRRYSGWKDFRLWWLVFILTVLAIYGFFLWFDLSRK
jgi:Na+/proline symporter